MPDPSQPKIFFDNFLVILDSFNPAKLLKNSEINSRIQSGPLSDLNSKQFHSGEAQLLYKSPN